MMNANIAILLSSIHNFKETKIDKSISIYNQSWYFLILEIKQLNLCFQLLCTCNRKLQKSTFVIDLVSMRKAKQCIIQ